MTLPFSEASERNKLPILEKLKQHFTGSKKVLEIGSGTGQHAVYFAEQLPELIWQTGDLEQNHELITARINEAKLNNVLFPIIIHLGEVPLPSEKFDAVFTSNTLHIMSWENVKLLFAGLDKLLETKGLFCVYGPFNYGGKYTSESNENFDSYLRQNNPLSGIRNFEDILEQAKNNNLRLLNDYTMPANNRLLIFEKI